MNATLARVIKGDVPAWAYVGLAATLCLIYQAARTPRSESKPAESLAYILSQDPPSNAELPSVKNLDIKTKAYVLCISPCLCNIEHVSKLLKAYQGEFELIIVVGTYWDRMDEFRKALPKFVRVVPDPQLKLSDELNAQFLPRGYVADKSGKLLWKQESVDMGLVTSYVNAVRGVK